MKRQAIYKEVITDVAQTAPYLVRYNVTIPVIGWTIKLHQILRPDGDRCPHDHPWWFWRVILAGGYEEVQGPENKPKTLLPWRPWAPWRVYFCPVGFRHRITRILNGRSSWSLVLTGPRVRPWGFFTKSGFVGWREFISSLRDHRVAWCEDGSQAKLATTAVESFRQVFAGNPDQQKQAEAKEASSDCPHSLTEFGCCVGCSQQVEFPASYQNRGGDYGG